LATTLNSTRHLNFAGGPALIPDEVLLEAQESIWNHAGTGVGILETGHRTATFDAVMEETLRDIRAVGEIPQSHDVLLLPGGAQMQFALLPTNALRPGDRALFIDTGTWSARACADAARASALCGAHTECVWSGSDTGYRQLPPAGHTADSRVARYLHYCSNNTIEGTHWGQPPACAAPLVCDATSDIFSRPWPMAQHAVVFAGAQKNLGIAGLTLAVVERDFLQSMRDDLPLMMSWRRHSEQGSRLNTPPTFAIYVAGRMAAWILRQGGVAEMAARNARKSAALYQAIDQSGGFFSGTAHAPDRSTVNVSFRCATKELDAAFITQAAAEGMVGLEGHRIAGGIRASMYNASPESAALTLAEFMRHFATRHG
jgi:phosphoserine aminotransferase